MDTLSIFFICAILAIVIPQDFLDRYLRKNWEWYNDMTKNPSPMKWIIIATLYFGLLFLIAFIPSILIT